jgi:hypothetical protein
MTQRQDAMSEELRDHAVATLECDVPVGWSLDEWRTVRSLAREVTTESGVRWRRLLRPASRRSPAAAAARSAAR